MSNVVSLRAMKDWLIIPGGFGAHDVIGRRIAQDIARINNQSFVLAPVFEFVGQVIWDERVKAFKRVFGIRPLLGLITIDSLEFPTASPRISVEDLNPVEQRIIAEGISTATTLCKGWAEKDAGPALVT